MKPAAGKSPESRRPSWLTPYVAGATGLALLLGGAGVALVASGGDDSGSTAAPVTSAAPTTAASAAATAGATASATAPPVPAQQWRDDALVALRPLTGIVVNLGRGVNDWRDGKVDAASAGAGFERLLVNLGEARTAITAQPAFPAVPRALSDLQLTTSLYLDATRMARAATVLPKGPLQEQTRLAFYRLRDLGDRFFDQADAELAVVLGPKREIEGVTIVPAAEVPDWRSVALAAGQPLADPQRKTPLRDYQKTRPQQGFAAWSAVVDAAGVPSADDERAALTDVDGARLRALALRFVAASDALYAAADPAGGRLVSTRLQLGLLTHAEAMWAAEAASLTTGDARARLLTAARDLAAAADTTWYARLGERSTGFPPE